MVHTVGLSGVNGNVGAPAVKGLVKAAEAGKIKLILLHRRGSPPKDVSQSKNVTLRALNSDDPPEKIEAAVQGVNVYISAVGFPGLQQEVNVVEALAKSPDFVTYVPPAYSTTWTPEDYESPHLGPILVKTFPGEARAREKNLSVTGVYTGAFDFYVLDLGFFGSSVKSNTVWANKKQLQNGFPVTAMEHLGDAIVRIATADPQSIKNRDFSVVTFRPTGQELAHLYTKINGKEAQIKDYTPAEREELQQDVPGYGPMKVGYFDRWENDSWTYKTGKTSDTEYNGPGLEELARRFA